MNTDQLLVSWDYNEWANRKILLASGNISPELFTSPVPSSFGSLRGTLVHIYGAELVWRLRCQSCESPAGLPAESLFPDLVSLRTSWEDEMCLMRQYLRNIDPGNPDTAIRYRSTKGIQFTTPLWQIIVHLINHGTQFRSEAGLILSSWGHSPGDMDMIYHFRENLE